MSALLLALSAAPALAAPPHLHCLEAASGQVVSIGRGVTMQAPHDPAFDKVHGNVHVGVFILGNNPLDFGASFTGVCPTSVP